MPAKTVAAFAAVPVLALAAALVGGLESFALTTAGGLAIGMVQSLLLGYAVQPSTTWIPDWLPTTGLQQLVPVAVIVAVLVWRGDALPDRAAVAGRRLPPSPEPRHLLAWTAALGGAAALGLLTRKLSATLGEGLILDLRRAVFDHVQRMPVAFFTRTRTGALVSRLNNDVIGAQRAFSNTLSGVVSNLVTLLLTLAVMLTLSWQITLLALVVSGPLAEAIGGAIGVYYYLRPMVLMYMRPTGEEPLTPAASPMAQWTLAACVALVLLFGLYPSPLVEWSRASLLSLAVWNETVAAH